MVVVRIRVRCAPCWYIVHCQMALVSNAFAEAQSLKGFKAFLRGRNGGTLCAIGIRASLVVD